MTKKLSIGERVTTRYKHQYKIREYLDATIINMFPGTKLQMSIGAIDEGIERYNFDDTGVTINHPPHGLSVRIKKHRDFAPKAQTLVKEIINECLDNRITENNHWRATVSGITDSAVARFASPICHDKLITVISLYSSWSSQTYEGSRIHHCVGLDPKLAASVEFPEKFNPSDGSGVEEYFEAMSELLISDRDELKVLGSYSNSLLLLDNSAVIDRIEPVEPLPSSKLNSIQAPLAFCHMANWTKKPKGSKSKSSKNDKVAVILTRNGEILIFSNGKLQFAKRRGAWRYFPHDSLANDVLHLPAPMLEIEPTVRKAVYLTALDVAFTRGGACLGIVDSSEDMAELILKGCSLKEKRLHGQIVANRKFQDIPRSLRAELAAIDGATILDRYGNILCVGAIMNTSGNAEGGGGRSAAAKAISKFGIGIKVSNDGEITAYTKGKDKITWA